ncbi:MAG TPA: MYXO-CTERM sorting domain-containing protein [Polyangiaceae bacterium]|jgi:hypothetical protein
MARTSGRRRSLPPFRWLAIAWLAVLALLGASPRAWANGRFPRSERVIEDPSNAQHLLVAATYGLLTTTDRGAHWYHICEAAFAEDPTYGNDPLLEIVSGGALLVDVQSSIRRAPDGCAWSTTFGSTTSTENVNDMAVDPQNRNSVVAVVTRIAEGGTVVSLEQSTDAGGTWSALGTALPLSQAFTIDVDPTDATHLYATGLSAGPNGTGVFLRSMDHGTTWTSTAIPGSDSNSVPYIAVVDPLDPAKIFVRTDSTIVPADAPEPQGNDALLYSSDGGNTWTQVLQMTAKLLGLALSPDGTTVIAGYGDPVEAGIFVDPTVTGIYESPVGNFNFQMVYAGSVTGLTWSMLGVYASTAVPVSGTREELAFFPNAALGAAPTSLMTLSDVLGPPPCCAGVDSVCDWTTVCVTYQFFACGPDSGTSQVSCTDAGSPAADASAPDATTGGHGLDAGAASVDASVDSASDGGAVFDSTTSSGCGCRVACGADGGRSGTAWLAVGAVGLVASRRRRRGSERVRRKRRGSVPWKRTPG